MMMRFEILPPLIRSCVSGVLRIGLSINSAVFNRLTLTSALQLAGQVSVEAGSQNDGHVSSCKSCSSQAEAMPCDLT